MFGVEFQATQYFLYPYIHPKCWSKNRMLRLLLYSGNKFLTFCSARRPKVKAEGTEMETVS